MSVRWRACQPGELEEVAGTLATWPCGVGGAVRHMFPLATLDEHGNQVVRIAQSGDRWAAAILLPRRLLVPCGDAGVIAAAGPPSRRWRLLVGDAAAADAVLDHLRGSGRMRVHVQRFMTVVHDRIPGPGVLPDPGLRLATEADLDGLAELAVRLHVDDRFGPDPGRTGFRGYRRRLEESVEDGVVYCVGAAGEPVAKIERSVSSRRWGVQLAGIVVDPRHRGTGLGRSLVAEAVRAAAAEGPPRRPISLHVRADNDRAIRAYRAAGFVDREEWRLAIRS